MNSLARHKDVQERYLGQIKLKLYKKIIRNKTAHCPVASTWLEIQNRDEPEEIIALIESELRIKIIFQLYI